MSASNYCGSTIPIVDLFIILTCSLAQFIGPTYLLKRTMPILLGGKKDPYIIFNKCARQ